MNTSTIEIAITGPDDRIHPNSVYVQTHTSTFDGDRFRRAGSSTATTGRADLVTRGAQFHKLPVPAWLDPKEQAIKDLRAFASLLRSDYYNGYAVKAEAILATLDPTALVPF